MQIPFTANNGQAQSSAGTINNATAIKSNTIGLNSAMSQGLGNGSLNSADHAEIHAERQQIGALRSDCATDPSPGMRSSIRQDQRNVMSQIQGFESGNEAVAA